MNKVIRLYKLVRKLYAKAKANPAKYEKFELQVKALINAKDDKEMVNAITSLAFTIKGIYSPARKRKPRKPKTTPEPVQPPTSLYTDPRINT